jgi:iron(III) transport system substrate-binding protein
MPILRTLFSAAAALAIGASAALAGEVNVYSYRQPFLVEPLFAKFTKATGHTVNVVFASKGLIERAKQEGRLSPMDVLLTADIGNLTHAKEAGITAPVEDAVIDAAIPAKYRDPEGHWIGLTSRIRVIYASKERVQNPENLTYEALAEPEFEGRVCTRSGKHAYQIALVAAMINHHGAEGTEQWLTGLKNNLARKPSGNDRAQVKAIWQGQCDVALGNSYYYVAMMANPDQRAWAESVNVVFPNQKGRGAHANISGMALAAHAPNKDAALALMRYLTGEEAQRTYAEVNGEYPLREGTPWSDILKSLGTFTIEDLSLEAISEKRGEALLLTDRVGYDQ